MHPKPENVLPSAQQVDDCCRDVIRTGFGRIAIPLAALEQFERITGEFAALDGDVKQSYSFAEDTDGFLPFASEYARSPDRPDQCERFCYWHAHRARRTGHPFHTSAFVRAMAEYELAIHGVAQAVLDAICAAFGAEALGSVRAHSYLQFCAYAHADGAPRAFAQDPHEDGHLLSLIKPGSDGLALVHGAHELTPVRLLANEVAVLAGSLLSTLSDQAIAAAYHAVLVTPRVRERRSLMYFVNPDTHRPALSFHRREPLDLQGLMQARHRGFGNRALSLG